MLASWTYSYSLIPGFGRPSPHVALLLLLILPVLLGACSTPRRAPMADDPALRRYAEQAYQSEIRHAIEQFDERWPSRDPAAPDDIAVSLSLPKEAGTYPLIVYLPGLGEPAVAGQRWRSAWSEAGYAVLALQPQRFGPGAMQGRYARNADFTALARENYTTSALAERLRAVASVLTELQLRVERKQAPYDRIDPSRWIIAGYDLGAQAAQVLAGEHVPGIEPPLVPLAPRAAVLISPYAQAAAGGLGRRFGDVRIPTLTVTSLEDTDSFGLVGSTAARTAPFTHMPAGDKYLLLLANASHRALSGDDRPEPDEGSEARPRGGRGERGGSGSGDMPPGGAPGGGMGGGMGGGRGGIGGMGERHERAAGAAAPGGPSAGDALRQGIALQRISVAFLDALVGQDTIATEWLARDAERWLARQGELRRK